MLWPTLCGGCWVGEWSPSHRGPGGHLCCWTRPGVSGAQSSQPHASAQNVPAPCLRGSLFRHCCRGLARSIWVAWGGLNGGTVGLSLGAVHLPARGSEERGPLGGPVQRAGHGDTAVQDDPARRDPGVKSTSPSAPECRPQRPEARGHVWRTGPTRLPSRDTERVAKADEESSPARHTHPCTKT